MMIKCSPGNKPCGKRCVPIEHKCKGEKTRLNVNLDIKGTAADPDAKSRGLITDFKEMDKIKGILLPKVDSSDAQNRETGEFTVGTIPPGSIIRNYFTMEVGQEKATGRHYGIYLGKGKIAHIKTGITLPNGKKMDRPQHIVVERFEDAYNPTQSKWEMEPNQTPARTLEQVQEIVEAHAGAPYKYDFLHDNCESFARAIVEKKGDSIQGRAPGPFFQSIIKLMAKDTLGVNLQGLTKDYFEGLDYSEGENDYPTVEDSALEEARSHPDAKDPLKPQFKGLEKKELKHLLQDLESEYKIAEGEATDDEELSILFTERLRTVLQANYLINVGAEIPNDDTY